MSVSELMFMYNLCVDQGYSLNINCGTLRRIGKTTCIKELIRGNSQRNNVVLVPNRNLLQDYAGVEVRPFVFPTDNMRNRSRYELELSQIVRGRSEDFYVYADEVPDAENIMEMFRDSPTVHFVAGFYSIDSRSAYHRPAVYTPAVYTPLEHELPTIARILHDDPSSQIIVSRHMQSPRRLASTLSQATNFFEASWVSNASDEAKTEIVLDKAAKMKFIINEN